MEEKIKNEEPEVKEKRRFKGNKVTILLIVLIIIVLVGGILELTTNSISKGFSKIKNWYLKSTGSVSSVRKYTWKY